MHINTIETSNRFRRLNMEMLERMKSNCARYHVLPDKNGEGVMIFDTQSGTTQYPACWQDLAAYYHYLLGRGRFDESQKLLAECMSGNKPISSMLVHMSQAQVNMS